MSEWIWYYAVRKECGLLCIEDSFIVILEMAPTKTVGFQSDYQHLFQKKTRHFTIGGDVRKVKDLGRYVRWPRYIRLQRQRAILKKRLKTPPSINHFYSKALNGQQAAPLFNILSKYQPETKKEKKDRLLARAESLQAGKDIKTDKPKVIKFGVNHVTHLIEKQSAKLVLIAHDVTPLELVLWMPALCRAMNVPYVIVKGKARLGQLVHQKTATCVAVTDVNKEDLNTLNKFIENYRPQFNDAAPRELRQWGSRDLGSKANAKIEKLRRAKAKENKFQMA